MAIPSIRFVPFFLPFLILAGCRTFTNEPFLKQPLDSGQIRILDQTVGWKISEIDGQHHLIISGVTKFSWTLATLSDGKPKRIFISPVYRLNGEPWKPEDLQLQIERNNEAKVHLVSVSDPPASPIDISTNSLTGWHHLRTLPLPIRSSLRDTIKTFVRSEYPQILRLVSESRQSGIKDSDLPLFLRSLVLSDLSDEPAKGASPLIGSFQEDRFESSMGLISPSTSVMTEILQNRKAPNPEHRVFFPFDDPIRPIGSRHTLFVVHASDDFHYPVRIRPALSLWLQHFHEQKRNVVFILHDDEFNDASYFVRPEKGDLVFHSETGHHPICEDCVEATFTGGFIDWCLSLAIRSYIANAMSKAIPGKARSIRINLASDSIYTDLLGPPGTMGPYSALDEIQQSGIEAFFQKRIAPYVQYTLTDEPFKLCPLRRGQEKCKYTGRVKLANLESHAREGRFYPRLKNDQFRFRFQLNGTEFAAPAGSRRSQREIIFNVVTQAAMTVPEPPSP